MACVNHDAIKHDPLLRQPKRELEVSCVSGMVEVHCYRNRCLVCTELKSSAFLKEKTGAVKTNTSRQKRRKGPFPCSRVTGKSWRIAGLRARSAARTSPMAIFAS